MLKLTPKQVAAVNNINTETERYKVGDRINEILENVVVSAAPKNAVNAIVFFGISGVVKHHQKVWIDNDNKVHAPDGTHNFDRYVFTADDELSIFDPKNDIAVDISSFAEQASGVVTMGAIPISGDTITIGGKTYIFVPDGTANADGEVTIGSGATVPILWLRDAINGIDGHNIVHPTVRAEYSYDTQLLTIHAYAGGTDGNAITMSETFTSELNTVAAQLSGGSDCSAANAITALIGAINQHDTQGVSAAASEGGLLLSAVTAGASGNFIGINYDPDGNWATVQNATHFAGGVDGTVGNAGDICQDGTYLYICTFDNTTAGKSWCRISLGSAY